MYFSYRERLGNYDSNNKAMYYIKDGCKDVEEKIHYDILKRKNVKYSVTEKINHNALWIGYEEGVIKVKFLINGSYNNPTTMDFKNWEEFEKWARHNFAK